MGKLAFVFPGQGAQKVGMGKDFYDNSEIAQRLFKEADEALGYSIMNMCFEGPEEDLKLTANTQPAILTMSVIAYELLKEKGIEPEIVGGHSLGEYSALVAAGVLNFKDAVLLVHKRGQYMQEAVPVGEGGMAAIIGVDRDKIIEVCAEVSKGGDKDVVQAVNLNCPGQTVIAGATAGVEKAELHDAKVPVVANVNGKLETKADEIKKALVAQAASPVLWEDCVAEMLKFGADTLVEAGPGKTLCGFNRRIDKSIKSLNVEDLASLEKTVAALQGEE